MRHPITGRRISLAKYETQQVAFAKRIAEMKAEEKQTTKRLVYSADKVLVLVGDTVKDFRGDTAKVTGWAEPKHSGSTGRLYVNDGTGQSSEYFPSVYGLEFV